MKLTVLIITIACLQVSAKVYSQISLSEKNAPLATVIASIQQQSGYSFLYKHKLVENINVTAELHNVTLQQAMDQILAGQPLTYEVIDKAVVIKQKEPTILDKLKNALTPTPPPGEITGHVENKTGESLPNATILIKRTKSGTLTDAKGNFILHNVNAKDTLIVSFIGYKLQYLPIGDQTTFTVIMEETTDKLDEVVVQAYGKTTQRLATGNIGRVTAADIEKQPVSNPLQALQGRVPGLIVTQTSGYASAPFKVEIRGRNSINPDFTSDPLYIIDGVPLTILEVNGNSSYNSGSRGFLQNGMENPANGQSPFFSINPSDIESIEVLKDADATSIYGSRGANGVILITTKKGKPGKTKLDLSITEGVSEVTGRWDMLNTQQYLQVREQAFKNVGRTPSASLAPDLVVWDTTRYTDWQKYLWGGIGKTTNVQSGLSGGDAQTQFRIGAGYNYQTSILAVSGSDQRSSLSFSLTHKSLNQRFSLSLSSSYSYTQSDMIFLPGSVRLSPDAPSVFDANGNLNYAGWAPIRSQYPFASLLQPYTSKTGFLNSGIALNYEILKGLTVRTNFGYSTANANQVVLYPIASQDPANNPTGSANFGVNTVKNWIVEPQAEYNTIISKGQLNVLIGASSQYNSTDGLLVNGRGYTNDALIRTISNAPTKNASDNFGQYRYAGFFGRIGYNWEDKYIINLNARRDGSSRFGSDSQYGNFGSIGAAWIFTEENWFKNNISFLSYGKLRSSYGTTGSDAVGDYQYLTRWTSNGINGNGTVPYNGVSPLNPTQHADPLFQWQVNKKFEAAIDLGFFKDRILLGVSYYRNTCDNELVAFPVPYFTGFNTVTANSPANVLNAGWEVQLNTKVFKETKFKWDWTFNIGINHNKLLGYPNLAQSPYATSLVIGQPLNIIYLLHYTGVDPKTGQYTFEDKNKDGNITVNSNNPGAGDDRYIYDLNPKFSGGFGNNMSYGNWQLSFYFNFIKQIGINALSKTYPGTMTNQPTSVLSAWQKPGDISNVAQYSILLPTATNNFASYSDGIYTDASFIRLQNLSLSYNLPKTFLKKLGVSGCRVYMQGQNLFVISGYKGIDPETQNFGGVPPVKIFTGGISFNF